MSRPLVALVTALSIAIVACGDDDSPAPPIPDAGPAPDAAVSDDAGGVIAFEPVAAALPVIPWLDVGSPPVAPPALTPCPSGWREVAGSEGESAHCDPWPAAGPDLDCPDGEAHLPGRPGCAPIGATCTADGWPAGLPADRPIVYVNDDASDGGDGSSTGAAYRSIRTALARAPGNAILALSVGTYDEAFTLNATRAVWGACAARTRLTSSSAGGGVVELSGSDVELRNVTIEAPARAGIVITEASASARISGVVIRGARPAGIFVDAGRLDASDVVVRDTRAVSGDTVALQARRAAHVTLTRALFANQPVGIAVLDADTTLVATDVALVNHSPGEGRGVPSLVTNDGAHVELSRVVIDHADRAFTVEGATLVGHDVVVRDMALGMRAADGAQVELTRVHMSDVSAAALSISTQPDVPAATTVRMDDAVLTDFALRPAADPTTSSTSGIAISGACELDLSRVELLRSGESALVASDGAAVRASDLRVSDVPGAIHHRGTLHALGSSLTLERVHFTRTGWIALLGDGAASIDARDVAMVDLRHVDEGASGVVLHNGASAHLERLLIERASTAGVEASEGSSLDLADVVVRDLSGLADGFSGRGISSSDGTAIASRVLVERAHEVGVVITNGTATITDLTVRDTSPIGVYPQWGLGVAVQTFATATLDRVSIEGSTVVGLNVIWGASLDVSDLAVRGTGAACTDTCDTSFGGFGLLANAGDEGTGDGTGATLRARDLLVEDTDVCSVVIGDDRSNLDLEHGTLRRSPTGACVQADGYDLARLMNDVAYLEIRNPVEATRYEVPTALPDAPSDL